MKFVEIDEILNKMPNKYAAIILAAKEARKIIEARKPPPLPKESDELSSEVAIKIPEALKTPIEKEVKKRGRKPKKLAQENTDSEKNILVNETSPATDLNETVRITDNKVVAEKEEENPYMAALRKVVNKMSEKEEK